MKRARKTKLEKQDFDLRIKRLARQVILSININNDSINRKISNAILVGSKAVDPNLQKFFSGQRKFTERELSAMQTEELTGLLDLLKAKEIFRKVHARIKQVARENKIDLSNVCEEDLSHVRSA